MLITPVLSPLISTSQSAISCVTSHKTTSYRATDSAHSISLLSIFQPSQRCQAAQCLPTTSPISHDKDASTHTSGSTLQCGKRERDPPGVRRTAFHQWIDSTTD